MIFCVYEKQFEMAFESKLEVLVICPGRTGTLSMKQALQILLDGKILHYISPDINMDEWTRFREREGNGEVDDKERMAFFAQFSAAVGTPVGGYWRELIDYFPDSKVIVLKRDPDEWFKSISLHTTSTMQYYGSISYRLHVLLDRPTLPHVCMRYLRNCYKRMLGRELDFDKEATLKAYAEFYKEVEETLKERGLPYLTYNLEEGWGPLCKFMGMHVPGVHIPRAASHSSDIEERVAKLRRYQNAVDIIKFITVTVFIAIMYYNIE